MRYALALVSLWGLASLGSGCAMPASPVLGSLYTGNVKGPIGGVDNSVKQTKTGMSMASGILGVSTGDASISAAMKAGGLTKVHHTDFEAFSIMSFYSTFKTTVYGE
jgi:hypothetical protein